MKRHEKKFDQPSIYAASARRCRRRIGGLLNRPIVRLDSIATSSMSGEYPRWAKAELARICVRQRLLTHAAHRNYSSGLTSRIRFCTSCSWNGRWRQASSTPAPNRGCSPPRSPASASRFPTVESAITSSFSSNERRSCCTTHPGNLTIHRHGLVCRNASP